MKESVINQKVLYKWGAIYALILAVINFFGYLIVTTAKLPMNGTESMLTWEAFKAENRAFIGASMGIIFLIPFVILAFYLFKKDEKTLPGRIINLPVMYAFVGSLGWIIPYLFELGCLAYVAICSGGNMHSVALFSFMNVIQSALFIGTFAFMSMDAVHRRIVLPKYFSEGKLEQFYGMHRQSVRRLISIFYMSVGVIPVIYLISVLYNYSYNFDFEVEKVIYEIAIAFITLGFIMLSFFSRCFIQPLSKLQSATDAIKEEQYGERVDIVSCDEFGILADNFNDMAGELDNKAKRIIAIQNSIIKGMAVMIESRDNSTGGHIYRTSDCVRIFVEALEREHYRPDLSEKYWQNVIKAAPMHDLGKIAIDDAILRKPGRFTEEEYEKMKEHSKAGAGIVENVLKETDDLQFKEIAVNVAHFHHEKWNGTGYPEGISKEQIPLEARIMALADVFDALVSKRCYKESISFDMAFEIIEESLGTHFDPELGVIFLKCRPKLEELYSNSNEDT